MDIKLLETYTTVVMAGSLTGAASVLGVTQSIVSRRVTELERLVGTRLLYRHGRGVRATPAGELLARSLPPVLGQLEQILSDVSELGSVSTGAVNFACSPSMMAALGAWLIQVVARRHPGVRLQTTTLHSRYVHEWLLQGRINIGLLSDVGLSNHLAAEDLGSARVVLVAPPVPQPWGPAGGSIPCRQLDGLPLILSMKGNGIRRYLEEAALLAGIQLRVAHEVDDIGLMKDLVLARRGYAILSELAVRREVQSGQLSQWFFRDPALTARAVLATALNRPITPAMKAVMEQVREGATALLTPAAPALVPPLPPVDNSPRNG